MRIAFETLGCKVNQYETEALRSAFISCGDSIVSVEQNPDAVIINTCSVTNISDRKSRQCIRRTRQISPNALILVTGCLAQTQAENLARMPEADIIVSNNQKSKIVKAIHSPNSAKLYFQARDEMRDFDEIGVIQHYDKTKARAYIKIQEGCDRFCSYCLIPYSRGPLRSRNRDLIIKEAKHLIEEGFKEIVLTGINTALYEDLMGLLQDIDNLQGDFRIRLSSLEPTCINDRDITNILGIKRLCHHLHLSVQSGSNHILQRMNRNYTRQDYQRIVKMLRDFDPLYNITTDIIVGFPGETDEDFEDSLSLVREIEFGKVHIFRFSPRAGTKAATLPDRVHPSVSRARAQMLLDEASKASTQFLGKNLGTCQNVLIEELEQGKPIGYTDNYLKVRINSGSTHTDCRDWCKVTLKEINNDYLLADMI